MAYVIGLVVLVVVVAAALVMRQRSGSGAAPVTVDGAGPTAPAPSRPEPEPMTGLESALARVTDRDGRPIREHLEAEAGHVDELRVPDDTGPLLRRALDHVEHVTDAAGGGADDEAANAGADDAGRDDTERPPS